jgi:hypothetical protein
MQYIGTGDIDITLPVVTPDYTTLKEIRGYGVPRFWVDLLQRQSGKLRWRPIGPARVRITRYDHYIIRGDHVAVGNKALLDSLKVRTSGRRDRKDLFYFGAIFDDGSDGGYPAKFPSSTLECSWLGNKWETYRSELEVHRRMCTEAGGNDASMDTRMYADTALWTTEGCTGVLNGRKVAYGDARGSGPSSC